MRLLFLGDVVGRAGRDAVCEALVRWRREWALDFVVVCGENAAHGFGVTAKIAHEFFEVGVDVLTTGNHVWDQREIISFIDTEPRLLRPVNFPPGTPGRGAGVFVARDGRKVLVIQAMGRLFMDPLDDPFAAVQATLERFRLGGAVAAAVVDIHAEASSEKMALGHFCDGRASLVAGTHTHVPTADAHIMAKGTAYITDLGMCGDYNSVIGMGKEAAIARFTRKMPLERLRPCDGEATLCGCLVETDDVSGLAREVRMIRVGGCLSQAMP